MSLFTTQLTVLPEWIDHNGHMNVAFFVLAFDIATDSVYETWGIGESYPEQSGCSVFTLGLDVDYLGELFEGDRITITTQLLDWDHKRLHYYHSMANSANGKLTAVNECLAMNVNLDTRRSASFSDEIQAILRAKLTAQGNVQRPEGSSRRLGIKRRSG